MTVQEWLGLDNKLGVDIWNKKYRHDNETFDEWLDRVSSGDEQLRNLIKDKKFMFGGRITANRNTGKKASMMNCYSRGFILDSLDDIMQANTDIAMTFKTQGGQGLSLSKLRPKGCAINHGQFESDGIIPFMELYNRTTESISQGGSRKGALLIGLDIWHKEAEDFIKIKSEEGRIQKANLSLEIDDEFMECVKKYYDTGEVITKHIIKNYEDNIVEYDVTPINLYKLMMNKAYDWAEPGCIFTNRFRNYNLMEFCPDYSIEICNPCVTGDTRILTNSGHYPIKELVNKKISVWNGYKFSEVVPVITAKKQALMRVEFSNGSHLICTPYHKFILKNGERVECEKLKKGDKLVKCEFPIINGKNELKNPYTQGFFSGDGFECKDRKCKYISFYGEHKKPLSKYCATINQREDSDKRTTFSVNVEFDKNFVPINDYTINSKIKWLAGIADSDGSNNLDGSICITSINKEFIEKIFYMLETLGVSSTYAKCKESEIKFFKENMGNKKYLTQDLYRITISASDVIKLNKLGFSPHRLNNNCIPNRDAKRFIEITSLERLLVEEDVYCFTENENHSGIFNGIITAQCGEQPLGKNSACDLGSINLSEFVIDPFTDKARFDFDNFAIAIDIGVRVLDEIIDENQNNHALKEQKEMSLNYRNIGLGTMGMWDMLCKLNMKYGSEESKNFVDYLFGFMFRRAVIASSTLAKEKGTFSNYSSKLLQSEIIRKHFTEEDIKILEIDKYGLRNCSLLSIAPTGSIGTMLNISTGCEPAFRFSYKRKTESLNGKDTYYDVYIELAKQYMSKNNTKILPETFVSSSDIQWKDRIDMQSILQKHVDTAISSTVNLPNNITVEEIEQLYLYAWEKGLKGITIFRDGCARTGILFKENTREHTNELKLNHIIPITRKDIGSPLDGRTYIKKVACGTLYITINHDDDGNLLEVFVDSGKSGGCAANAECLGRYASASLRSGMSVDSVIDITQGVKCAACTNSKGKGIKIDGISCGDVIAKTIKEEYTLIRNKMCSGDVLVHEECKDNNSYQKKCPQCGGNLAFEGGCNTCKDCGWSKCD